MLKFIIGLEQKIPSRPLKLVVGLLLLALCVGIPAYAEIANINSPVNYSVQCASTTSDSSAALSAFYQNVFAVMAIVLGLVVGLAYLTIRAVSREAAQRTVQDEVENYFTRDKPFLDNIEKRIVDAAEDKVLELGIVDKVIDIESRVNQLEKHDKNQDSEENGGDKNLTIDSK